MNPTTIVAQPPSTLFVRIRARIAALLERIARTVRRDRTIQIPREVSLHVLDILIDRPLPAPRTPVEERFQRVDLPRRVRDRGDDLEKLDEPVERAVDFFEARYEKTEPTPEQLRYMDAQTMLECGFPAPRDVQLEVLAYLLKNPDAVAAAIEKGRYQGERRLQALLYEEPYYGMPRGAADAVAHLRALIKVKHLPDDDTH